MPCIRQLVSYHVINCPNDDRYGIGGVVGVSTAFDSLKNTTTEATALAATNALVAYLENISDGAIFPINRLSDVIHAITLQVLWFSQLFLTNESRDH